MQTFSGNGLEQADIAHECAIFLAYRRHNKKIADAGETVLPFVLQGLKLQSNRGQEGFGISAINPMTEANFRILRSGHSINELARLSGSEVETMFAGYHGTAIIGHNRYATYGPPDENNSQPMQNDRYSRLPPARRKVMAFNGHIANADELRKELIAEGERFNGPTDTEVLLRLIVTIDRKLHGPRSRKQADYEKIFAEVDRKIDGACSLILFDAAGDMVLYRNRHGIRPLEFMETTDGILLAASETEAFSNLEGQRRTIAPGELFWYNARTNKWDIKRIAHPELHYCILELLYFGRANSIYKSTSNYFVRNRLGVLMAEGERARLDGVTPEERQNIRVMPVPNTAIPYAIGMAQALNLTYEMGIERNSAQRAFINTFQDQRLEVLQRKFTTLDEAVQGKSIWVVDDTLIRRDTSQTITNMLRRSGAKQVEWFICAPPFQGTCYYGIAVPTVNELAYWQAVQKLPEGLQDRAIKGEKLVEIEEQIARDIHADRVKFLDMKVLLQALPGPSNEYCHGCFERFYPTPRGKHDFSDSLRQMFPNKVPEPK